MARMVATATVVLCLGFLVHFVVADKRSLAVDIVVNTGRKWEDGEENGFGRRRGEGGRRKSADERGTCRFLEFLQQARVSFSFSQTICTSLTRISLTL